MGKFGRWFNNLSKGNLYLVIIFFLLFFVAYPIVENKYVTRECKALFKEGYFVSNEKSVLLNHCYVLMENGDKIDFRVFREDYKPFLSKPMEHNVFGNIELKDAI